MLTQNQLKDLADLFQIDQFTILREFLQLTFLKYLYQTKRSDQIYFKGGTAIRLLLDSPRFSEDLDFSTPYNRKETREIIEAVVKKIQKEITEIKVYPLYEAKNSTRFRLKYSPAELKYPLNIRLDFTHFEKSGEKEISPLITPFPIGPFPVIVHFGLTQIMAEKVRALFCRAKGRDIFDLWFLLEKGVAFKPKLIQQKLALVKVKSFRKEKLVAKIKNFPQKKLKLDLNQFLSRTQRKIIPQLKKRLIDKISRILP